MKKSRYVIAAAATGIMVIGLSMGAQANTKYSLEITNQYDTEGTSRDDKDKNSVPPWSCM